MELTVAKKIPPIQGGIYCSRLINKRSGLFQDYRLDFPRSESQVAYICFSLDIFKHIAVVRISELYARGKSNFAVFTLAFVNSEKSTFAAFCRFYRLNDNAVVVGLNEGVDRHV